MDVPVVSWEVWAKKAAISLLRAVVSPEVPKPGNDLAALINAL